jgi:hypothetical protein
MRFKFKRNDNIGAIFFVAFVLGTSLIYQFEERFNQKDWHNDPTQRHKLVDDLLDRELLKGKTKTEVISFLGQPNSKDSLGKDIFLYNLGSPPSFTKSAPEQLLVVFENQKVLKVVVTQ